MGKPKGSTKTGGRKPGSLNTTTASVKAALCEAFGELGGVASLVKWGKDNPTEFYKLWGRLVPVEVKNADGEPFELRITRVVVDRADAGKDLRALPDAG